MYLSKEIIPWVFGYIFLQGSRNPKWHVLVALRLRLKGRPVRTLKMFPIELFHIKNGLKHGKTCALTRVSWSWSRRTTRWKCKSFLAELEEPWTRPWRRCPTDCSPQTGVHGYHRDIVNTQKGGNYPFFTELGDVLQRELRSQQRGPDGELSELRGAQELPPQWATWTHASPRSWEHWNFSSCSSWSSSGIPRVEIYRRGLQLWSIQENPVWVPTIQ